MRVSEREEEITPSHPMLLSHFDQHGTALALGIVLGGLCPLPAVAVILSNLGPSMDQQRVVATRLLDQALHLSGGAGRRGGWRSEERGTEHQQGGSNMMQTAVIPKPLCRAFPSDLPHSPLFDSPLHFGPSHLEPVSQPHAHVHRQVSAIHFVIQLLRLIKALDRTRGAGRGGGREGAGLRSKG
jgi:hypothetical protein